MRTVLLRRTDIPNHPLSESEARAAFAACTDVDCETVVLTADATEARCLFATWAQAGKAAAAAHGDGLDACVEALRGGKNTRLIVRNLPFRVDVQEMRAAFAKFAPVREVRLAPPRGETKAGGKSAQEGVVECAGFGFVEYFLVADAKFALGKMNGAKIGGRVVAVDMALGRSLYVKRVEAGEEAEERDDKGEEESESDAYDASSDSQDSEDESVDKADSDEQALNDANRNQAKKRTIPESEKKAPISTADEMTRTIFVRNLLFETSAAELWKAMETEFGPVEQAVLVMNRVTSRPRGTAFVRFASEEDADNAVARGGAGDTSKSQSRSALGVAPGEGFVLQGRPLMLSKAVDRSMAKDLSEKASAKEKKQDPRNLKLAWVGQISAGTPEAKGLSAQDIARRSKSAKDKKTKLERNPNAFVSDIRLSVRNLPKDCDEKMLKQLFLVAAQDTKDKTKSEADPESSKTKKSEPVLITHCTVVRDAERNERSKGYGFVQFQQHEHALAALHATNNNPKALDMLIKAAPKVLKLDSHRERLIRKQWGDGRRLHVEFSVEDRRKVQLLEQIKEKGRKMKEANKLEAGAGKEKKKSKRSKQKVKSRSEGEEEVQPEKKLSKSDRKSAMKRKRAEAVNDLRKNTAAEEETDGKSDRRPSKKRKGGMDEVGNGVTPKAFCSKSNEESFEMRDTADKSDPKPKKPRKKRKPAEVEQDAKLDSLVHAYKRKLEKGAKKQGMMTDNTTGKQLQPATISRWFD